MLMRGETELSRFTHPILGEHVLYHRAAGEYPAGSLTTHTPECWGVCYRVDGARHGRRFSSLANAELYFRNSGAYREAG